MRNTLAIKQSIELSYLTKVVNDKGYKDIIDKSLTSRSLSLIDIISNIYVNHIDDNEIIPYRIHDEYTSIIFVKNFINSLDKVPSKMFICNNLIIVLNYYENYACMNFDEHPILIEHVKPSWSKT